VQVVGRGGETGKSLLQKVKFPRDDPAKVHVRGGEVRLFPEVVGYQQSILEQEVETDKVGISGKGGETLVG
jgi:hypothetical protein